MAVCLAAMMEDKQEDDEVELRNLDWYGLNCPNSSVSASLQLFPTTENNVVKHKEVTGSEPGIMRQQVGSENTLRKKN